MNLVEITKSVYAWMHATDARTWLGHFAQGFVLAFLHPAFALGAFAHREASDLLSQPGPAKKRFDHFMDFWSPCAGIALAEAFKQAFRN